ncbi:MAG: ribonuclease III [Candidatus Contendobacter odensis]|uniref:Ribonuclease 3 n=1 Tax=Candidatus Contendibacter odensensis TaxID=1400860 RepID=A0A2G6PFR8_9GAMM|nr:MAG: ribonuclease III [Candidatus Contendobacter odensis]
MKQTSASLHDLLGYTFHQAELLEEALTHRSFSANNNERLEFLGDALLGVVMAEYLYQQYPDASEGDLSRLRASLVKGETLAGLARDLSLGQYLHLGLGEIKSGGGRRSSILSDAMEAVIGAVYLDSGFDACHGFILRLYQKQLAQLDNASTLKDPKTRLQEHLQAQQKSLPVYSVLDVHGEPHTQQFTVECIVENYQTVAVGSNRRKAEQEAARQMLEHMT